MTDDEAGATPPARSPGPAHLTAHGAGSGSRSGAISTRLNWLRAGVLGANDGIISTAGLVVGVAGATTSRPAILAAGVAGLLAGALSMAAGEYVSVCSQRDSERASLAMERWELDQEPQEELEELTGLLMARGLTRPLAREAAEQLTERDALRAHARVELGIDPDALANPWHAALASLVAFTVGALLPLLAITLPGSSARVPVTVAAVLAALILCGVLGARLGGAPAGRAVLRNVAGGALAMAVTYAVGTWLGTTT
ncbi:VIT family protein [Streptomyces sp. NPDC051567]|uniref:VIT family protein n=1 Tax=Streptomyces sp. NPDC051567 TaxID=3365660 RepID=UPI003791141F